MNGENRVAILMPSGPREAEVTTTTPLGIVECVMESASARITRAMTPDQADRLALELAEAARSARGASVAR